MEEKELTLENISREIGYGELLILIYSYCVERGFIERSDKCNEIIDNHSRTIEENGEIKQKLYNFEYKDILEFVNSYIYTQRKNFFFDFGFINTSISEKMCNLFMDLLNIVPTDYFLDFGSNDASIVNTAKKYTNNLIYLKSRNDERTMIINEILNLKCEYLDIKNNFFSPIQCDKIVCFPEGFKRMFDDSSIPSLVNRYVMKENNNFLYEYDDSNSYEWRFIDKVISSLKDENSKGIIIVKPRVLLNEKDKEIWRNIVLDGYINTIISLPSGSFGNSNLKTFLIIVSKNNRKVRFIKDEGFLKRFNGKLLPDNLNTEMILNIYKDGPRYEYDNESLMDLDNLIPENVITIKEHLELKEDVIPISELADILVGTQYTLRNFQDKISSKKTGYQILTSSDIVDGLVNYKDLPYVNVDEKYDKFIIHENDIIMTSKSTKIKTTVVESEPSNKVIVTGAMLIIRPIEHRLDPYFLKAYLDSNNGRALLSLIQKGGTAIINISVKDLKELRIDNIPYSLQHEIGREYYRRLFNLKRAIRRYEEAKKEVESYYDEQGKFID